MRDSFVRTLLTLAQGDPNIELLTGDLGFGVLRPFWEALPDQFLNVGIAEQNMISMAAGMALEGKTVFVYSIGNFPTMRCLEQIRNDCAYPGANVKIVCVGAGFAYGALGMSHHATEDLAVMRALPGVTVFSPADRTEAEAVARAAVKTPGTCYIRLGRGGEAPIHTAALPGPITGLQSVQPGSGVTLLATGDLAQEAVLAAKLLKKKGLTPAVYTVPTVCPIDGRTVLECACNSSLIVTCEEHDVRGGLGTAVAELLAQHSTGAKLVRLGIPEEYCSYVGTQQCLRHRYGLTGEQIARRIEEALV